MYNYTVLIWFYFLYKVVNIYIKFKLHALVYSTCKYVIFQTAWHCLSYTEYILVWLCRKLLVYRNSPEPIPTSTKQWVKETTCPWLSLQSYIVWFPKQRFCNLDDFHIWKLNRRPGTWAYRRMNEPNIKCTE